MLKKLIKYDFIWVIKIVVIFMILGLSFAIIGRLFSLIPDSFFFDLLSKICNGTALSLLISAMINAIMRSWARLTVNLFKDESYLTHTLPVDKLSQYLSKVLTLILSIVITFVVLFIGLIIMYYSKETFEAIKSSLNIISDTLNSSVFGLILVVALLVLLEFTFMGACGNFGIIYGNTFNQKKMVKSIIYGIISYAVISIFSLVILLITSLFSDGVKGLLFGGSTIIDISIMKTIMWCCIGLYFIFNIVLFTISYKIFKKGVNID